VEPPVLFLELSDWGRRASVWAETENLMVTLAELSLWREEKLPEEQPSLQLSTNQAGEPSRRTTISGLIKQRFNFFDLNGKRHVWKKAGTTYHLDNTIPTVGQHQLWGCLRAA